MKLAVGIFVITLFLSISTFLYLLLEEKGTFDKRYSFHFNTDSASSFNVGMPLKFSGFDIGVIDNISLGDDGSVDMIFSVNEENRKWVSKGSTLVIKKPLIGSPHIEIHSVPGNEPLEPGSLLTIKLSDDINGMISKLEPAVEKIIKIIDSVDTITAYIASEDSSLIKTLQNVEELTHNLAKEDSLLTTITGDKKSTKSIISSLHRTDEIMLELHKTAKDISKITASLDEKILNPASSSAKELELIMKDIKNKLDAIDSTVKTVGSYDKDLVELKEQVSVAITKSNQIMDKVDSLMQDTPKQEVELP